MPYREQGKIRGIPTSRFAMVPRNDVPRSAFDYRVGNKTTMSGGLLVPFYVEEILPGDSLRVKLSAFARLATAIVPIMDNLYVECFFFFCPNRLVWADVGSGGNWERFMGEQLTPSDVTTFLVPQVVVTTAATAVGSIYDYLGVTLNGVAGRTISVNVLPYRAYNLIWNEWFRDEDIIPPAIVNLGAGPDPVADAQFPRLRGKRHDYFTSARPWPQKPSNIDAVSAIAPFPSGYFPGGNEAFGPVKNIYGVGAPVTGLGVLSGAASTAGSAPVIQPGSRTNSFGAGGLGSGFWSTADDSFYMMANNAGIAPDVRVLVNDIRTAVMVQGFMEKNARGGSRYAELIRSHFGVMNPDARLQRPEFLGGGRGNITVNPVAQSQDDTAAGGRALGELSGVASGILRGGFTHSFTEHGYVLGLVSVRADLTYQHGTERMWFRRTPFDFYWPSTAHLGEQAVFQKELFSDGSADDNLVFGYQERWSEYKWRPSRISGAFRSNAIGASPGGSMDVWHLAQDYGVVAPTLNEVFVSDIPPLARVEQFTDFYNEQIWIDTLCEVRAVRCMPMFSVPGVGARL